MKPGEVIENSNFDHSTCKQRSVSEMPSLYIHMYHEGVSVVHIFLFTVQVDHGLSG